MEKSPFWPGEPIVRVLQAFLNICYTSGRGLGGTKWNPGIDTLIPAFLKSETEVRGSTVPELVRAES